MLLRLLLCALTLGTATGCDDRNLENDLVGTRWVLDEVTPPSSDTTALSPTSILFPSREVVEIASCNTCSGPIDRFSHELDFSGLSCTEVACTGRLDLGPRLGAADRVVYSLSDDGLLLIADEGGALSTFSFIAKEE